MSSSCKFCGALIQKTTIELYTQLYDYIGPVIKDFPCSYCSNCDLVSYSKEQTDMLRVLTEYFYNFNVEVPVYMEYEFARNIYVREKENYSTKKTKKKEPMNE